MPAKESLYGLLGPKKLNPNLVVIGAVIVILTIIVVYSGRHTKITISKGVSIEANIPPTAEDTSNVKRATH